MTSIITAAVISVVVVVIIITFLCIVFDDHFVDLIRKPDYDPTSQIGAYSSFDNAKSMCIQGYCIFDQNGTLIYSNPPAP